MRRKIVLAAVLVVAAGVVAAFTLPITVGGKGGPPQPGSADYAAPLASTAVPPVPPKFGGEIKPVEKESKVWWPPGKHTLVFDFEYDGIGFGLGGRGTLKVNGHTVDSKRVPKTLKFMFPEDETFDVGVDTRTPIDDRDYQVPFRFTGKLNKLTVEEGPIKGTLAQILEFKWKTRD